MVSAWLDDDEALRRREQVGESGAREADRVRAPVEVLVIERAEPLSVSQ